MPAPLINQGSLNRIRGSIVIASFPVLTITSPFMGKNMYSLDFSDKVSDLIGTATGGVPSPQPYQDAILTVDLLKTNGLAQLWKQQIENTSTIGTITCYTDTSVYGPYQLDTCVVDNINPAAFAGNDPTLKLTIRGIYRINNALWDFVGG